MTRPLRSCFRRGGEVALLIAVAAAGGTFPRASQAQTSPAADAQQSNDPEKLLLEGVRLRKARDDIGALYYLERAYKLAPGPQNAGHLGLCEMAVFRFVEAEVHLAEALRSTADPWVNDNRTALSDAMRMTKNFLGTLEIVGRPE